MPFFLALALLLAPHPAAAAGLHGRVMASPSLAAAGPLSVAVDAWACGNEGRIGDPRLVIGEGRGIAHVVVRVMGSANAPPYNATGPGPVIDQKGCVFVPHLVIAAPGVPVRVRNSDRLLHTFRTKAALNRNVNKAQTSGKEDTVVFAEPEIVRAACDVHYWMGAVIVVAEHAWTVATDEAGRFALNGLPAGRYQLELWHETLGTRRVLAEAGADGASLEVVWEQD